MKISPMTSITEYLTLLGSLRAGVADWSVDDFYYLSRATLVKDEKYLDRFDVVFGHVFKGLDLLQVEQMKDIPTEWLKRLTDSFLTEEEKKQIEEMGGYATMIMAPEKLIGSNPAAVKAFSQGVDREGLDRAVYGEGNIG